MFVCVYLCLLCFFCGFFTCLLLFCRRALCWGTSVVLAGLLPLFLLVCEWLSAIHIGNRFTTFTLMILSCFSFLLLSNWRWFCCCLVWVFHLAKSVFYPDCVTSHLCLCVSLVSCRYNALTMCFLRFILVIYLILWQILFLFILLSIFLDILYIVSAMGLFCLFLHFFNIFHTFTLCVCCCTLMHSITWHQPPIIHLHTLPWPLRDHPWTCFITCMTACHKHVPYTDIYVRLTLFTVPWCSPTSLYTYTPICIHLFGHIHHTRLNLPIHTFFWFLHDTCCKPSIDLCNSYNFLSN